MILRCPDFRGEREKSLMIQARVSALVMMALQEKSKLETDNLVSNLSGN